MTQVVFLLLLALVFSSCSITLSKKSDEDLNYLQWRQHQKNIQNLSQYQALGTFTYLSNQKKIHAHFFFQQFSRNRYHILLTNFLGGTELKLDVQCGKVELTNGKGQRYIDDNIEVMMRKLSGISIPINNFCQWILGLPGEDSIYKLNKQHYISEISYIQKDKTWKVVYNGYDRRIQPPLPLNIELTEGNKRIKLKIDNWIIR